MTAVNDTIRQWASRQLADYDSHQPGSLFAEGVVLTVDEGYALQAAVANLRQQRGEQIVGYKVGCTSPTIRDQLGIDHCVFGRLFASERHPSGAELSGADYANLAIEGELAVELSREPVPSDFTGQGVPPCVARIMPVIELHNHVLRGEKPTAGELIAHNAIHAGFVAAPGIAPGDLDGRPSLSIFADNRLLDACRHDVLLQTIHSSLKWLTETLNARGNHLTAGQIILTGSIPSLIPITKPSRLRVAAPPFGEVEAIVV